MINEASDKLWEAVSEEIGKSKTLNEANAVWFKVVCKIVTLLCRTNSKMLQSGLLTIQKGDPPNLKEETGYLLNNLNAVLELVENGHWVCESSFKETLKTLEEDPHINAGTLFENILDDKLRKGETKSGENLY